MSRFSPQPEDYENVEEDDEVPSKAEDWSQVDTRKRRVQRDLSVEEMEARDRQAEAEKDYEQNVDVADSMYRRKFY